jgi:hypothetical protein
VISGELTSPEAVDRYALELAYRNEGKRTAPDISVVAAIWSRQLDAWSKQLNVVMPWRAYINEPAAADLKKSANNFIVRLQELVGRE